MQAFIIALILIVVASFGGYEIFHAIPNGNNQQPHGTQSNNPTALSQTYAEPEGLFTISYPSNWKLTVTPAVHAGSVTVPTQMALSFFSGNSSSIVSVVPGPVVPSSALEIEWNSLIGNPALLASNGATKVTTTISGFDAVGISKTISGVTTLALNVKTPTRITEVNESYTPDSKATADAIVSSLVLH